MNEPGLPGSAGRRYVLYDFDADELVTTQIYDNYTDAADDANQLSDVLIIPINLPTAETDTEADQA